MPQVVIKPNRYMVVLTVKGFMYFYFSGHSGGFTELYHLVVSTLEWSSHNIKTMLVSFYIVGISGASFESCMCDLIFVP